MPLNVQCSTMKGRIKGWYFYPQCNVYSNGQRGAHGGFRCCYTIWYTFIAEHKALKKYNMPLKIMHCLNFEQGYIVTLSDPVFNNYMVLSVFLKITLLLQSN